MDAKVMGLRKCQQLESIMKKFNTKYYKNLRPFLRFLRYFFKISFHYGLEG